jgi:hypothetical protein
VVAHAPRIGPIADRPEVPSRPRSILKDSGGSVRGWMGARLVSGVGSGVQTGTPADQFPEGGMRA